MGARPTAAQVSFDKRLAVSKPMHTADRSARIAEIRRQIAAGVYETPEKLEQAVERMLGSLLEAPDHRTGETPEAAPRLPR